MMDQREEKNVGAVCLVPYMKSVIKRLEADKKRPAMHTYYATLSSFTEFSESGEEAVETDEKNSVKIDGGEAEHPKGGTPVALPLSDVFTPGKLKEYENWMRSRDASWNTVSTYMRVLKAVYNRLVADQVLERNEKLFDGVYTQVEAQTKRALNEEQMETLMDARLHADFGRLSREVQCALAYFQLMFLLRGMPFVDFAHLRKQDLKGNCLSYCRHKTGRKMVIRIPKEAMPLLEEYRNKEADSGYLFPILDDGKTKRDNGTAKRKDARDGYRTDREMYARYQKALRDFNRRLAKMAALLLPGVGISSYTARHTWATLAFYSGMPVGIICKALGHSSIKVTETYLKPFENEKVDAANEELIISVTSCGQKRECSIAEYDVAGCI